MHPIVSFFRQHHTLLTFFFFLTPVLLWSGWEPHGRELWLVESLPLWIGLVKLDNYLGGIGTGSVPQPNGQTDAAYRGNI